MRVVERTTEFNERALLSIDSCLYTKLLSYYITKDNKKRIIDNMDKILLVFDKINEGLCFLSESQAKQISEEIERIYKTLISVSDKMASSKEITKIKKIRTIKNYIAQIQNLQHRCAYILIKIGYKEKLETLDVYSILKLFIFEKKDFEIVRMLFSKVPSLVYFEEMSLILHKIFNKCISHLLDDEEKFEYYKKVFEYLINLNHIKVSKQERKHFISKLEEKRLQVKKDICDKHLIKEYVETLNSMISMINKNQDKKIIKTIDEINKKYGISNKYSTSISGHIVNCNYVNSYVDLTDKYTISIDCKGTLLIDDAISFEVTPDEYILDVYIADLKPYIERNSNIDKFAREKAFTINLPKNYVPMLPLLSNENFYLQNKGIKKNQDFQFSKSDFSLRQGNKKSAVAHRFVFSKNMDLISFDIFDALISVDKNYNYEMIEKIIKKGKDKKELEYFKELFEFQDKLNKLGLFSKEYHEIKQLKRFLDSDFTSCEYTDNSTSSKLISSFMILTNYFVSKKFENLGIPFIYCVNKSTCNKEIIDKIKLESTDSTKVSEILKMINDNYYPSKYSLKNEGHQGLGLDSYCHATNPIRNYSSLVIQRLEQDFLFDEEISDLLVYAWEDYLEELVNELNDKKDKYKVYCSNYYKFYNSKK